jgi:hypothetical protein
MIRRSATHIVERGTSWSGRFATEPWETAWASEAIFFVRRQQGDAALEAGVQISPDGMNWVDEGSCLSLAADAELAFVRVREFGGWLRLAGTVADGQSLQVVVSLSLKE